MFNSHRCYKGGKMHNFQPRYDEKQIVPDLTPLLRSVSDVFKRDIIRAATSDSTVYVKDVCIWCGKTIERDEFNSEEPK